MVLVLSAGLINFHKSYFWSTWLSYWSYGILIYWPKYHKCHQRFCMFPDACVTSTFVQLQCGDGDTLVMTASLSTQMQTWKGWGAWMSPVCWHFSLSNTGVSHIHARSWGGLIQLEIRQMKTLECGWYNLLTVPITLLIFPSFILIQFTALPTLFLSMELDLFPRTLNTIRLMTFSASSMLISMQIITPLRSRPDFITYCTYFS